MEKHFKITVDYYCYHMIDEESFASDFNNDPFECYRFISNEFEDSVFNFSHMERVVKVELIEE